MCEINDNLLFISTFPYCEKIYILCFTQGIRRSAAGTDLAGVGGILRGEYVTCNICKKKLRKCSFEQHYRLHTGEKPFQCVICNMRFVNRGSLHHHKRICRKDVSNSIFHCRALNDFILQFCELIYVFVGLIYFKGRFKDGVQKFTCIKCFKKDNMFHYTCGNPWLRPNPIASHRSFQAPEALPGRTHLRCSDLQQIADMFGERMHTIHCAWRSKNVKSATVHICIQF